MPPPPTSVDDHGEGAEVLLYVLQGTCQLAGDVQGLPARQNRSPSPFDHVR